MIVSHLRRLLLLLNGTKRCLGTDPDPPHIPLRDSPASAPLDFLAGDAVHPPDLHSFDVMGTSFPLIFS